MMAIHLMTMGRMQAAREGFLTAIRLPTSRKRRQYARMRSAQWVMLVTALVTLVFAVYGSATRIINVNDFVSRPVVEILFPPNDFLLVGSEIEIEVAMRMEMLRDPVDDQRVCIGISTVHVPSDVKFDAGHKTERCYSRHGNYTTFDASGLLAGVRYAVSAGLVNHGRVIGYSLRTFEVASILLQTPDATTRLSIDEAVRVAEQLQLNGELADAMGMYKHVLQLFPTHIAAMHRLGQLYYQQNEPREAIDWFEKVLGYETVNEQIHVSMGLCLKALGRTMEAIQHFRIALELKPTHVHAALELGLLWKSQGKWDEAIHEFRKVVTTIKDPPQTERQILEPPYTTIVKDALAWLCEILRVTDGVKQAERCLSQAVGWFPQEIRFHIDRGHLLLYAGQFEVAQREYEAAAELGSIEGMIHAADVLEAVGQYEASIERYEKIYHHPEIQSTTVLNQVAVMMTTVLPRILPATQDAIDVERERFRLNVEQVITSMKSGMHPIELDPSRITFSTATTMNAHNRNNKELKTLLGQMYHALLINPVGVREEYVNSYGLVPQPFHQRRNDIQAPPNRLRVGFISRFFYTPAVGLFMDELLPQLDTNKYEVFAFGIGLSKSFKIYEQVAQIAEHVVALPRDLRVARDEIRAHKLDLVIFPELGLDKTTYFLSFHRVAPVQAAWWGNPDTSGVPAIDYYLTSEHEHKNFRDHYTEPTYQMKGMGIYHVLPKVPNTTVASAQMRRSLRERFNLPENFHFYLSIESMLHFHPDFDEALRQILDQDPLAHVFLIGSSTRKKWKQLLSARIDAHIGPQHAGRVTFFSDVDLRQEMQLLNAADVVLGSLRLTRPKAAMHAFTAGVPVVTLAGELWATRITAAFYKQMGIRDLTATTIEEYVAIALRLANDEDFRARATRKVRHQRDRLSADKTAVQEWEAFFDMVHAKSKGLPPSARHTERDETTAKPARRATAAIATCPATSLLDLW